PAQAAGRGDRPAGRRRVAGAAPGPVPGPQAADAVGRGAPAGRRRGGRRGGVAGGRPPGGGRGVSLRAEPLTHMDAGERTRLRTELAQLQHGLGVTAIYVTHDQSQAMAIGDRGAVMRAGRIEQLDEPRTLYLRPANTFVASFMGEPAMNLVAGFIEEEAGRSLA